MQKEEKIQGYTNTLIFQNVFDDLEDSLEKFRCRTYRIKYVEPKKIPVSGKMVSKNNEK